MTQTTRSFLMGATAVLLSATIHQNVFAAPKPDADVPPVKPKMAKMIKAKAKSKRTFIRLRVADHASPLGIKAVVIDEPNLQDGTLSVVTDANEFATIATGMGTKIARGYQMAGLANIHPGYVVRCQGAWDQDGFQYQATRIALGSVLKDTAVIGRVNAACTNISTARKGGGFGQSMVAMAPPMIIPKATGIGDKSAPDTTTAPVPADMIPKTDDKAPGTTPTNPAPVISPSTIPPIPPTAPAPVVPPQ